ncbi:LANO_0H24608g1_1 [Lachancea nothofagi CBS 11611]|uniref:LANO_0H24608g1_1 n=1 Tax=Lachancea nothofagi CBS 11611 TaxID=1266666 RepID=A0A1G4KP06_9SACH|nr:LANO_0H24608g1_1 [Lachancea nothofagi CBS 11611]
MSESSDFQEEKPLSFDQSLRSERGKRKKLACVECRQQKSKCDAHEKAPGPCTRCAKKSTACILQKDFRRTYKRVRNEAIEQRFKELTKSLSNLDADEILKKIELEQQTLLDQNNFTKEKVKLLRQGDPNSSQVSLTNSNDTSNPNEDNSDAITGYNNIHDGTSTQQLPSNPVLHVPVGSEKLKCSPKSLGEIYMSAEDISELYVEFVTKYHPFLPVVDVTKGPELIYKLSPCLFWVIMLIGLRRKFKATDFMTKLSSLVKSILAEITMSPIIRYAPTENDEPVLNVASVYSVQAFLLYTFWPPLTSSLSADTSWNTMGSAMFQAIRVGLNCAEFSTEYATTNSDQIQEQVKTWICCNIVSQMIASSFGFPAFVSFDHTVISACRSSSKRSDARNNVGVPQTIKQMMHIAYFENQLTKTMNSNPLNAMGMVGGEEKLPLLHVLEQQLGELEIRLRESKLDDIRKFLLLVAKVHLLTYCFTGVKPFEDSADLSGIEITVRDVEMNFEAKRGFVKVYNVAMELLMHTTSMCKADPNIIKSFPGVFVLSIWQTACIISKLSHSSLDSVLNLELGKKIYQEAVVLTYNASVLKYDMAYRSSGIMKSIWSMFSNMHTKWKTEQSDELLPLGNDFNLDITIKSRMSASVFFDCLYKLREKCGMAKLKRELRSGSEDNEMEDDAVRDGSMEKRERRLSGQQDPEENARKLIKTIPLDPEPINAPMSGSSAATPNSQPSDVVSLKSILNKTAVCDSRYSRNRSVSIDDIEGTGVGGGREMRSPGFTPDALIDRNLFETREMVKNGNDVEDSSVLLSHRSDSPAAMEHWDNWESDTVWKDVDILMNEFAFNPTL